jgi:hypothetical protein
LGASQQNPIQGEEIFMMGLQRNVLAVLSLAAIVALGLAAPAAAGDGKAPREAKGSRAGLLVAIDPATGQLRPPTAAEARALLAPAAAMTKSGGEPQFTTWPDGTMSAVLTADYLNVWLAQAGANGSLYQVCVDGDNAGTATAAPAFEEK